MPRLHTSWTKLRSKLRRTDFYPVAKRVGSENTLVVLVDDLKHDPRIPILYERDGVLYAVSDSEPTTPIVITPESSLLPKQPELEIREPESESKKPELKTKKSELKTKKPKPESKKPEYQGKKPKPDSKKSESEIKEPEREFKEPESEHGKPVNGEPEPENGSDFQSVMKSDIDQLVLRGSYDDEFDKYKDDDLDESELSKNLKKIRYSPTLKPPPASKPTPLSKPTPVSKPAPAPAPAPKPVPSGDHGKPKEPPKPDWDMTKKQLQTNKLHDVLKDLIVFESEIKTDINARLILKQTVMKCIQEDETVVLIEVLHLVYKLEYNDDFEFWSELVQRLKRKVNSHSAVRKFKVNANPNWVYENYQRAIISICEYATKANLVMKLPYLDVVFLVNHQQTKCKPEPFQTLDRFNVEFPDVKPKIKVEAQENSAPKETRKVKLVKNELERDYYKILIKETKKNVVFKRGI